MDANIYLLNWCFTAYSIKFHLYDGSLSLMYHNFNFIRELHAKCFSLAFMGAKWYKLTAMEFTEGHRSNKVR